MLFLVTRDLSSIFRNMEVAGCAHFTDVGFHALANVCGGDDQSGMATPLSVVATHLPAPLFNGHTLC